MRQVLSSKPLALILPVTLTFFCCSLPAHSKEKEVLVELFYSHHGYKELLLAGPCLLEFSGSKERLAPGFNWISSDKGGFFVRNSMQSSAKRLISADKITVIAQGDCPPIGLSKNAMRRYHGKIIIQRNAGGLSCYNLVAMKDYVESVVGSETLPDAPLEGLKAQSVIVQTGMLRYKLGDQLNDSTEKQAYFGTASVRPAVKTAVDSTWGETLRYKGKVPTLFFHSCCAGGTTSSAYFTGKLSSADYDKGVQCDFCRASSFWKETVSHIPSKVYSSAMGNEIPEISARDEFGRPLILRYQNGREERAYAYWLRLGQKLGWDKAPGTRFEIKQNGSQVSISSRGAGHGVGFCQWGASGMCKAKYTYKRILSTYYPGITFNKS